MPTIYDGTIVHVYSRNAAHGERVYELAVDTYVEEDSRAAVTARLETGMRELQLALKALRDEA